LRQAYDYWQDQPGNCPTCAARRRQHDLGTGAVARTLPRPEFITRTSIRKSHLKRRAHALPVVGPPLGGRPKPQTIAAPLNLVPRSHTFQELSPSPADSDRPLRRRLPANGRLPRKAARDAADLRTFSCKQIWPKAIKSTSSDVARRRQKRRCKTESRLQDTKPGQEPLPSEYILRGRHIDRSVRRRPAYSLTPRQAERLAVRQSEAGTAAAAGGRAEATSHRPFLVKPGPKNRPPPQRIQSRPNNRRGDRPSAVACLLSFTLHIVGKGLF